MLLTRSARGRRACLEGVVSSSCSLAQFDPVDVTHHDLNAASARTHLLQTDVFDRLQRVRQLVRRLCALINARPRDRW